MKENGFRKIKHFKTNQRREVNKLMKAKYAILKFNYDVNVMIY